MKRRQHGEARMEALLTNWKRLGCSNISTETGTFNSKSEWVERPENATEQGYLQCKSALEKLARAGGEARGRVAIEPYWRNIIDTIDRAERLFREVNSPALKLVMDPCNYFRKEDLPRMQPMLEEMFRRLGDADRGGPRQGREGLGRGRRPARRGPGRARLSALPPAAGPARPPAAPGRRAPRAGGRCPG